MWLDTAREQCLSSSASSSAPPSTASHQKTWLVNDFVAVLIGNKSDRSDFRLVPQERAQRFAEQNGMFFLESSAKFGTNIEIIWTLAALLSMAKRKISNCNNNNNNNNNSNFVERPIRNQQYLSSDLVPTGSINLQIESKADEDDQKKQRRWWWCSLG